jgi:hypothetical protein
VTDEPTIATKNALKNLPALGDAQMTFAAFEILRTAEKGQPLTGVLERTLPSLTVSDRMALLMDLAHLIGPATPTGKTKSTSRKAQTI